MIGACKHKIDLEVGPRNILAIVRRGELYTEEVDEVGHNRKSKHTLCNSRGY